jgi:hypothetical protein
MDPGLLGLIELVLVFGLVLGFAAWQFIDVSRAQRRRREQRPRDEGRGGEGRGGD